MTLDILLVEAHDEVYKALENWFTSVLPGCAIRRCATPGDGLDELELQEPDLVLIRSDAMIGAPVAAVEAFRADLPNVPLVVLTTESDLPHREELIAAGATRYVSTWAITSELARYVQGLAAMQRAGSSGGPTRPLP